MSFLQRAREAAETAADQAKKIAGEAADAAGQMAGQANRTAHDPATQEKLSRQTREAVGLAKRGVSTIVERIDPGTLAELIIKATALQEMTNDALRKKRSPYRISEISIAASIPPGVTFAIARGDDKDEPIPVGEVSSEQLVETLPESDESIVALDGTKLDDAQIAAARDELARDD